ncbi:hypothetical protein HOY82DRAFT_536355 [Tuber indicum]|nr:hypothetical protein HOY82DRAFT_536355 [Tuber indicum]
MQSTGITTGTRSNYTLYTGVSALRSHNDTNLAIGQTDSACSSKPPLGEVPHVTFENVGALNKDGSIAKAKIEQFEAYQNKTNIELSDLSKKLSSALEDLSNKIGKAMKDREIKAQSLADKRHAVLVSNTKKIVHQELVNRLGGVMGVLVILVLNNVFRHDLVLNGRLFLLAHEVAGQNTYYDFLYDM